jgi:hypothetical protein
MTWYLLRAYLERLTARDLAGLADVNTGRPLTDALPTPEHERMVFGLDPTPVDGKVRNRDRGSDSTKASCPLHAHSDSSRPVGTALEPRSALATASVSATSESTSRVGNSFDTK